MTALVAGVSFTDFTYRPTSMSYQIEWEVDAMPASMAVIAALSGIMEIDPLELSPLYYTIDPDRLDHIIRGPCEANGVIKITFTHEGHSVSVSNDGLIAIVPPSGHARRTAIRS